MIRALTSIEEKNQELIEKYTVNSVTIILTETGYKKSIMDATYAVRYFLESNRLHDYHQQEKGTSAKVLLDAKYYFDCSFVDFKISLYRPETKDGDPRLWFNELKKKKCLTGPCAFSIVFSDGQLYIFNLSNESFYEEFRICNPLRDLLDSFRHKEESVADELFSLIFKLHKKGWIPSAGIGDKAVGETLENALGIETNSSKKPDYKGIELKAGRVGKKGRRESRSNLFAQVADWSKSDIKSSKEMLDKYGYFRDGKYRLNCTVSTQNINSRGLTFKINEKQEELHEVHVKNNKSTKCLIWPFELLLDRLQEKHSETFWIEAESRLNSKGEEEFYYKKIIHTKKPFLHKLIPLIESGVITMDHLISAKEGKSASERGPLFKLDKRNLDQLFPEPNIIDLELYEENKDS